MDSVKIVEKQNPIENAGISSKIFFGWIIKFCIEGSRRSLGISDLYRCLTDDTSEKLTDDLEKNWKNELASCKTKSKSPSLGWVIVKSFAIIYFKWAILAVLITGFVRSVQPVVLSLFIKQFSVLNDGTLENKLIYGSILVFLTFLLAIFQYQFQFWFSIIGMRIRIACCSLVYRKLLRLSKKSLRQTASGQLVNIISNDVSRFDLVLQFLHYIWMMPLQVIFLIFLIWREVGVSSVIGVSTMLILSIPLQSAIARYATKLRLKVAKKSDTRIKLMDQLICGIQVIKMYVWEEALAETVKKVRNSEINSLTIFSYLKGILSSMSVFMERLVTYVTIISYVLLGNNVTAEKVFAIACFYNALQMTVAIAFPLALLLLSETKVSIKRIEQFLILEEKKNAKIIEKTDKAITISKLDAFWNLDAPVLSQIDVHIPPGTLCAIVGQVGSGKSSFLQLLLGELTTFKGSVAIGGSLSYSSQDSWIFASTVRKNILFGERYDKIRYEKVVDVCALKKDFEQFPYRDKTLIGDKGVSLSGGQRARINLARAVYRKADIYLLDDPLSAVDAHVGKHLFEKCIDGYLRHKTRILVTHQVQYLKKADLIMILEKGKVEAFGSYDELSKNTSTFSKLLAYAEEPSNEQQYFERDIIRTSNVSVKSENWEEEQLEKNQETLVHLKKSSYKQYARFSSHFCGLIFFSLLCVITQIITSGCDYWTAYWTTQEEFRTSFSKNVTMSDKLSSFNFFTTETYIIIYSVLIVGSIIFTTSRAIIFFKLAMNASRRLHGAMFGSLLQAPMKFFDSSPMGRILNRFSKDMGTIDEILPRLMLDALTIVLVMGGILVNVTLSNYWMIIACTVLLTIFYLMLRWFIAVTKDTKQIEGITRSPVFSHLSATFAGLTTIRASKTEQILIKEFDGHQDIHTSAWYLSIACICAYGLWLDLLSVIFIISVTYSFILMSQFGSVSSSAVGLAVQQSMILVMMLSYGVKQTAEMVSNMTAVDRVLEYCELEKEEDPQEKKIYPRLDWIEKGKIIFQNLSLSYSKDDPPVLKNLSFKIEAAEKIGIVGRTGAGKSSLISALFRLAKIDGKIFIDDIDTQLISLKDLRKHISIIPQEPVLFSETIRYNVDPFNEFDDKKIWDVLEEVKLKGPISSLDMEVDEGGKNFSVGQRQLFCLARAILRNNKILVLDEATANVDPKTDSFVQTTIRKKFKNFTVLTIAHRLNTVIDSDKILVMDGGKLVEFDHPHVLLQNKNGILSKLIAQTGAIMEAQLKELAKNCYKEKF